jgi:hypothetical protein
MNRVCRNKAGGVRVGYRAAGKRFSSSVVHLNEIYDNVGPGFVENVNDFEVELRNIDEKCRLEKVVFETSRFPSVGQIPG